MKLQWQVIVSLDKGGHCLNGSAMTIGYRGNRKVQIQGSA